MPYVRRTAYRRARPAARSFIRARRYTRVPMRRSLTMRRPVRRRMRR